MATATVLYVQADTLTKMRGVRSTALHTNSPDGKANAVARWHIQEVAFVHPGLAAEAGLSMTMKILENLVDQTCTVAGVGLQIADMHYGAPWLGAGLPQVADTDHATPPQRTVLV